MGFNFKRPQKTFKIGEYYTVPKYIHTKSCNSYDLKKKREESLLESKNPNNIAFEGFIERLRTSTYKKGELDYIKEFPLGTRYDEIERYIIYELPKRFPNIRRGVFDATGVGKAVYERVERAVRLSKNPYPVEEFVFSVKTKKEAVEFGVSAMEHGKVKINYNNILEEEMTGYKREITKDNNFIYDKGAGSDDYVDAMNLCIWNMALGLNFKPPIIIKQVPKAVVKSFGDKTWRNQKKRPNRHSKKIMNIPRRRL